MPLYLSRGRRTPSRSVTLLTAFLNEAVPECGSGSAQGPRAIDGQEECRRHLCLSGTFRLDGDKGTDHTIA